MRDFTICDAPQRSVEWIRARLGRLTASSAKDMLSTIKTGESAARRDLRVRLAVERLTGVSQDDGYVNADMQRGVELEAEAVAAYESYSGNLVQRVGFLQHVEHMAGCSPDGIIDDFSGGVEVKAPRSANHYRYIKEDAVPAEYRGQILHSLWITGAEYWDFVSYDPRFPEHLRLFVRRVPRVEIDILAYEKCALKFLAEVDAECASMAVQEVA